MAFRTKLSLLMLLSAGMALLIACLAMIGTHYLNDRASSDRRYVQIADVISTNLTAAVTFRDQDAIQENIGSVDRVPDIVAVGVFDAQGLRIARYRKFTRVAGAIPNDRWTDPAPDTRIVIRGSQVIAPILLHQQRIGTVVMAVQRNSFASNFQTAYPTAIAVFALGLLLAYSVALLLRSMLFRPIERLTDAMTEIGDSGDFSTRLGEDRDPDFNRIAQSFNYMLGEIEWKNEQLSAALVEVQAARDAEQISEAKSLFMANMSHELRTPLNAIIGYSEVLKEDLADSDQTQSYEDVSWIYSSAQQLMALINGVLDFSKISAGKMTIEVREFDPITLLNEVEGMLEPLAQTSNNKLHLSVDGPIGVVRNDPTKLKQCLLNLGSNACKFTQDGTISINAYERGDMLVVEVVDTGDGIEVSQLEALFEPFIQADVSTTRKYGGTGLGLPITRELARLMGGDVTASSEPRYGSIFTLEIKRDASELVDDEYAFQDIEFPEDEPAPLTDGDAEQVSTIVVVDDEESHVELMSRMACQAGHHIEVAVNARDGFRLIKSTMPSLAIIDIDMPGQNGWELLKELQTDPATHAIPVVVISVSNNRQKSLALGASDHLIKPVERSEFAGILSLYTEKRHGNVLIVEDDPATARLYTRAVAQVGFTGLIATSAEQALEIIQHVPIALIVSDLGLPGMSGQDLVDAIDERTHENRIPIVVVTGRPLNRDEIMRLKGKILELHYKTGLSPRLLAQIVSVYARPDNPAHPEWKE